MPFRGHAVITDFSYGEISPRWRSRVSGQMEGVYQHGCEELTNMLVLSQGGVTKREGTQWQASPTSSFQSGANFRLHAYREDEQDRLLLFRSNRVMVYDISTSPFTLRDDITTGAVWVGGEVPEIHVTQSEDEMIIFHPLYRPRVFRAIKGATLAPFYEIVDPQDDNGKNRWRAPQYTFRDTASPPMVKSSWKVTFSNPTSELSMDIHVAVGGTGQSVSSSRVDTADAAYSIQQMLTAIKSCRAVDGRTVEVTEDTNTSGDERLILDCKYEYYGTEGDGTGALVVSLLGSVGESTVTTNLAVETDTFQGTEYLWSGPGAVLHNNIWYRCLQAHRSSPANEPGTGGGAAFWDDEGRGNGDPLPADYTILTPDQDWRADEAYYPANRGWPSIGTFHEQRLIANSPSGRTKDNPSGVQTVTAVVAGSQIGRFDFLDFTLGENDSDGLLFVVANERGLKVRWFLSHRTLFIGTTAGTYVQEARPFTPTNVEFERHSMHRSRRNLEAIPVAGELFHVQDNGRQLRQVQYSEELDSWVARDLTVYAEHLLRETEQVDQWDFVDSPDPTIFVTRDDGALLSMSYQESYGVAAWAKHNVSDPVVDSVALYDGTKEFLCVLVSRREARQQPETGWGNKPQLEVLNNVSRNNFYAQPQFWEEVETSPGGSQSLGYEVVDDALSEASVYLDSYSTFTGDGGSLITGNARFANRWVGVVEDGVYVGTVIANADGSVNVAPYETTVGSSVHVGFKFPGVVRPNRFELSYYTTSQSQKIRWTEPVLRLIESALPLVNGTRQRERSASGQYDTNELFTGDSSISNLGSDTGLHIEADLPLPFHLTGVFGLMTVEGG